MIRIRFALRWLAPVGMVWLLAQPAAAQVQITSDAVSIDISGYVHSQFNTSSVDAARASEFLIRRARIIATVEVSDFVTGRIQPEFGEGDVELKDAYVRLNFGPGFRTTIGQFKRPFDLFELTSSTRTLVIERAGDVRGVDACAGPGGTCAFSRLTEKLAFADRDIGVMVDGADASGRFGYMVAVTNGTGDNAADENGTKSYSGRVTFSPATDVLIGGNLGFHDYVDPTLPTDDDYAVAGGADLEIGNFSRGLHVQSGVVVGQNWRNLVAGDPSTFVSGQGIVSYRMPREDGRILSALEPLARVSWGDPDTDASGDDGWLLTPGVMVHFIGRNKIAANLDIWAPNSGDTEWSLKIQSYLHF